MFDKLKVYIALSLTTLALGVTEIILEKNVEFSVAQSLFFDHTDDYGYIPDHVTSGIIAAGALAVFTSFVGTFYVMKVGDAEYKIDEKAEVSTLQVSIVFCRNSGYPLINCLAQQGPKLEHVHVCHPLSHDFDHGGPLSVRLCRSIQGFCHESYRRRVVFLPLEEAVFIDHMHSSCKSPPRMRNNPSGVQS